MMERLFLVGGSGFIGKNIIDRLHGKYYLHVIDKFIDDVFFNDRPDVEVLKIDLVKDSIPQSYPDPDYIINLASIVSADRDMQLFDELISTNLKVLLNLYGRYNGNRNLKLFIQFGSSEEYGNQCSPFKETQREEPSSPYALVKQLTVNTSLMLYTNYGFPTTVIRPGNVFGKYQDGSKFIPYVITRLKANESLDVTKCEQKRDFIYAEDFAWGIEQIITHYQESLGEIINLGSGNSISLKNIIEDCKKYINSSSIVNYGALPYRANESMDLWCSEEKLAKIIGSPIRFDINKRLKEYIDSL